jgi:hypothetical protein
MQKRLGNAVKTLCCLHGSISGLMNTPDRSGNDDGYFSLHFIYSERSTVHSEIPFFISEIPFMYFNFTLIHSDLSFINNEIPFFHSKSNSGNYNPATGR